MSESKPCLVLVGADKGGVGKTTVARALLSYLDKRKIAYRAIDTESEATSLRRFHKNAEAINLAKVAGQMSVFDALAKSRLTVIDIRAGLLTAALKQMHAAGFFVDVVKGDVSLIVLHVVDANIASMEEMGPVSAQLAEGGTYFVVRNRISEDRFGAADGKTYRQYFTHLGIKEMIEIPHLDDMAAKAIDREGVPFGEFAGNVPPVPDRSPWLAKLVNSWLTEVYAQFEADKIGLGKMLA